MKTRIAKANEIEKRWFVVDAAGWRLGRLATQIARVIRGKHKPYFSYHQDTGDYVIVVNAAKVVLTGNKAQQKEYTRFSGYPGGLKKISYSRMMREKPEFALHHAVKGMLPKNRLGRRLVKRLFVYAGAEHPHKAQQPEPLEFKED